MTIAPRRPFGRSRRALSLLIVGLLVSLGMVAFPLAAGAVNSTAPSTTSQLITVASPQAGSSYATLSAWARNADGTWIREFGPVPARVGGAGIGHAHEGSDLTPAGTFALTVAFGRMANPGTKMNYFQTDSLDWWDENPSSPTYNLHVRRVSSPGGASENLYDAGTAYNYAVNIGYNLARVPGAGSAFFLHVNTGSSTAGCVSIDQSTLVNILKWLDPAKHPYIDIRVGQELVPTRPYPPTQALNMANRLIGITHPGWTPPGQPAPDGHAWATRLMDAYPVSDMASQMATSQTRYRYTIAQAYSRCLGRNPSEAEFHPYMGDLATGHSLTYLYGKLCSTDAVWNHFGGNETAWIIGTFRTLVRHDPVASEIANYEKIYAKSGRYQVIATMLNTFAFRDHQLGELWMGMMGSLVPAGILAQDRNTIPARGWFTLVVTFAATNTFRASNR